MRVLIVGGVPARGHDGPVSWGDYSFENTPLKFSSFTDFTTPALDEVVIDRAGRDRFVNAALGYDIVICESPEAFVLGAELARSGARPPGVVAFDIQQFRRVRALRAWYLREEGYDPWDAVRATPWISWGVNSAHQVAPMVAAGIHEDRLHRVHGCTAAFSMFLPDAERTLDGPIANDGTGASELPAGCVAVPGTGRRDHATALRAARLLPELPFVFVAEYADRSRPQLVREGLGDEPNVRWFDPVPLETFIRFVRQSRVVVIPLLPGAGDGGHTTVGLAHRSGVPVVASDVPGIIDYVHSADTARLVAAADPEALAAGIREVWDDTELREQLATAGKDQEAERCAAFWEALTAAMKEAAAGRPRG